MAHSLDDVKQELKAMRECGYKVPQKAFKVLDEQKEEFSEYLTSMSVSEVADFAVDVAQLA